MMLSAAALLRRDETDSRAMKALTRIVRSGERATRLIHDLLDFTQAKIGLGIPVTFADVNLHQLAARVIDEIQSTHPDREILFDHSGDATIRCDADRVAQVLGNLLSNALTHGDDAAPVTVTVRSESLQVTLEVRNVGPPIPTASLPHIFQPMTRGLNQTDASRRSIGLGLFIVKEIVEAHRGTVTVRSTVGDSTTFTVVLPSQGLAAVSS